MGYTYTILFTCIINHIQEKKANHLHNPFSYNITTTKEITLTKICFISDVHYPNANNPQRLKEITKKNITILNDQEVQLNNITLIGRKDYTNLNQKKTKDYHLTNKAYNIVLDHQPQGTKENIKK